MRNCSAGKYRGPMHGMPVLVKDNIEVAGPIATTAGSLALAANITNRDAPLIARLREAGAVILGKTNLSEWANIRSDNSTSGWSAVGGLTKNPHALDRNACGSSSGSGAAMAAGLAAASHRHRNRWLDNLPRWCERRRRIQANGRPCLAALCRADQPQSGHCRADDPKRCATQRSC